MTGGVFGPSMIALDTKLVSFFKWISSLCRQIRSMSYSALLYIDFILWNMPYESPIF